MYDTDNVAIIVSDHGLPAGGRFPDELELIEHIPRRHKVTLNDIAKDGIIILYGEIIGYALRTITRGSWIDESLVELPVATALETLSLATKVPPPLPPLEGYSFEAIATRRQCRHQEPVGITTSVHCVAGMVEFVVKVIERDLLPKYSNVNGVAINASAMMYPCARFIISPLIPTSATR